MTDSNILKAFDLSKAVCDERKLFGEVERIWFKDNRILAKTISRDGYILNTRLVLGGTVIYDNDDSKWDTYYLLNSIPEGFDEAPYLNRLAKAYLTEFKKDGYLHRRWTYKGKVVATGCKTEIGIHVKTKLIGNLGVIRFYDYRFWNTFKDILQTEL